MKKKKIKKVKKKKTKKPVIKPLKTVEKAPIGTKRVREKLTKEQWVKYKIYCIENKTTIYRHLAGLVKLFLKKEKII